MTEPCSFTFNNILFHFSKDGRVVTVRHALQPGESIRFEAADLQEAVNEAMRVHAVLYRPEGD